MASGREDGSVVALRKDERVEMLRRVPLLAKCSRRDLQEVASVAQERNLESGYEVTREGTPGREFYVVIDGRLAVRRRNRKIAEIGPGGFFGEIALLTEAPRNATVETLAPSRVLVLRSNQFTGLLQRNAAMAVKIMQALASRIPPAATN
jgi:CRP-like cAMP-binding protein